MAFPSIIIGPLIEIAGKIFDRVIPDPVKKAEFDLEVMKTIQSGQLSETEQQIRLALGQMEITKIEAASDSVFKSGWRPAIGWTCAGGLFYQIIARPIFGWVAQNWLGWSLPPSLEMDTLGTILFGMLGLGAYRTVEKIKGAN
jgi:hypothetical protein